MKKIALLIFLVYFFVPSSIGAKETGVKKYHIKVSVNACKLRLYEEKENACVLVKEYDVATPREGITDYPRGEGRVTSIELNPWWYPTEKTRESYLKKNKISLPKSVPPGDKLNAMGAGKLCLSHQTPQGDNYRIHGTNDESSIGKRASRGCIRMRNADIKELIDLIKGGEIKVTINL